MLWTWDRLFVAPRHEAKDRRWLVTVYVALVNKRYTTWAMIREIDSFNEYASDTQKKQPLLSQTLSRHKNPKLFSRNLFILPCFLLLCTIK